MPRKSIASRHVSCRSREAERAQRDFEMFSDQKQPPFQHRDRSIRNVPRPSILKTKRPSMIIRRAMAKRVQPDRVMPVFLFTSHAVEGHADIPEKSANQPFVTGSGPCAMRRPKLPMPATIVHTHAANDPKTRARFRINDDSVVCSIRIMNRLRVRGYY